MSVVTAHMVYFYAFARSDIFQKNARKSGVGRGQFEPGVNGLRLQSLNSSSGSSDISPGHVPNMSVQFLTQFQVRTSACIK